MRPDLPWSPETVGKTDSCYTLERTLRMGMGFLFSVLIMALVAAVVVALLRPLMGKPEVSPQEEADQAVYRRQLEDLERDAERGLIPSGEVEEAKAEIGRRLLASERRRARANPNPQSSKQNLNTKVAMVVGVAVPVLAIAAYFIMGRPELIIRDAARIYEASTCATPSDPEIGKLASDLVSVLQNRPSDVQGWSHLARTNVSIGCYVEGAQAYAALIELEGVNADYLAAMGEAIVLANNGYVNDLAENSFQQAMSIQSDHAMARYYHGLYLYQSDKTKAALDVWLALLEETTEGAGHFDLLNTQVQTAIARLRHEALGDAEGQTPPASVNLERDFSVEDREMITSMVEGLAARLEESPDDIVGWERLIRSYMVLGDTPKARDAFAKASLNYLADRETLERLIDLSYELGIAAAPNPADAAQSEYR